MPVFEFAYVCAGAHLCVQVETIEQPHIVDTGSPTGVKLTIRLDLSESPAILLPPAPQHSTKLLCPAFSQEFLHETQSPYD